MTEITKETRTIEAAIRWHYYDAQRGRDGDGHRSGMDLKILRDLERCFSEHEADGLRREGERWAAYEMNYHSGRQIAWDDVPYSKQNGDW